MPRPRKFDEATVVEKAAEVFTANGYGGTSMEDLSRATGLGRQSIYNTFGGKRELFLRALSQSTSGHVQRLTEQLTASTDTPLDRIKAHLDALAHTFSSEGPLDSLFTKATVELADQDPVVAEAARDAYRHLESKYAECIRLAQAAGQVSGTLDAGTLASYFVAVTRGMEVLGGAGIGVDGLREIGAVAFASLQAN